MFLHLPLKVGYNLRKFGMTLSGRNYVMCRSILAAASLGGKLLGLQQLVWDK